MQFKILNKTRSKLIQLFKTKNFRYIEGSCVFFKRLNSEFILYRLLNTRDYIFSVQIQQK